LPTVAGHFPIRLYQRGKLVVSGGCYVHALQYVRYYFIEDRLTRGWMALPPGVWIISSEFKAIGQGGFTGETVQNRRVLHTSGRITAVGILGGEGPVVKHVPADERRIPSRLACGISANHPPLSSDPVFSAFTLISWPAFRLVATNRRVVPS